MASSSSNSDSASWTLVEGDDKPFARVKVLKTLRNGLKKALEDGSFNAESGYIPCGRKRRQNKQPKNGKK